jgi:serine/threonine-protein kinase
MRPPRPGDVLAGHRLLRILGEGTHGRVFLAEAPGPLGAAPATVAIKVVPLHGPGSEHASHAADAAEAFRSAAAAAQRLQHPNVVAVFGHGVVDGLGWLAMEAVPGTDLGRHTHPARLLPEPLALLAAERVAQALAHAHAHGVVHRDLKPANVLVHWPARLVKLADFGLARAGDAAQTRTGLVPGSPAYMAPELLAGAVPTPHTDLYALGALLFQLLTGRLPHEAASMGELLRRVAHEPAPDLRTLRPGMAPAAAVLVARLLAKTPAGRPADADAVASELRTIRHPSAGPG